MNASTDREMTVFWCKVAKPHYQQAFSVLLDMVLHPILDPAEMEKEREVILEELRATNDYPAQLADLLIDETLWPDQAMGRDVGGAPETVKAITLDDVRTYMERQYNPANTVVAVAGGITEAEVVELVGNATQSWQPCPALDWEPVIESVPGRDVRIDQRRTDQSHLCLGLPGLALNDPDRYALAMMNGVLGDGSSSRLFLNLRENLGLAYDVASSITNFRDCGSLVVYCAVEPRKTRESLQAIVEEVRRIREDVSEPELDRARQFSKGRTLLRMEDSRSVAAWLGSQELLTGQVATVEEAVALIEGVGPEDVARAAGRVVDENLMKLAVVGPHRSAEPLLKLLHF
jgi:predicted Zn-dependent peptidase